MKDFRGIIESIKSKLGKSKLLVVTKNRSQEEIRKVIQSGIQFIGENKLQEIEEKYDQNLFKELKRNGVELHFIGHLQKNKVNKAVRYCDAIQSVDSLELAKKIHQSSKRVGKIMPIYFNN